jgi:hypothetical protein
LGPCRRLWIIYLAGGGGALSLYSGGGRRLHQDRPACLSRRRQRSFQRWWLLPPCPGPFVRCVDAGASCSRCRLGRAAAACVPPRWRRCSC